MTCAPYYARMLFISTPAKRPLTSFHGQGHIGLGVPETGAREPRYMSPAPEDYDLWGAMPDREWAGRNPPIVLD